MNFGNFWNWLVQNDFMVFFIVTNLKIKIIFFYQINHVSYSHEPISNQQVPTLVLDQQLFEFVSQIGNWTCA